MSLICVSRDRLYIYVRNANDVNTKAGTPGFQGLDCAVRWQALVCPFMVALSESTVIPLVLCIVISLHQRAADTTVASLDRSGPILPRETCIIKIPQNI